MKKSKAKAEKPHPMLHGQNSPHSMKALKEAEGHMMPAMKKKKMKKKTK